MAVLFNPASPDAEAQVSQIQVAARSIGQQIHVVTASNERDFDAAFASLVQKRAGALFVTGDPLFTTRRTQLVALAAKHAIPASYSFRDLVVAGGLMSYGLGGHLKAGHRWTGQNRPWGAGAQAGSVV
jgi:putative ABC transport system substrate-binding protein